MTDKHPLRDNMLFNFTCKRCKESKHAKSYNHKRGICNLCVSKEDATIDPDKVARRRMHEFKRDMKDCDYSLESIEL